ncbi:cell division protein FtsI/penicillin-binding protein 2 [Oikeobacillus pervagus]|uniref:Cell division protein FtsI/penicillin-binding protein 2 n=1 Tax=Oikeobacillus pervagus TaxID=1325931 RepID=A0AAJ1T0N5_9BACI|nr:penicillin-binding transpeptidase domain-containing protein [Oikeobacillus pervagus]MDQ0214627.1 cell division protein FtsI/penicillin-binding protein 2 [Oikeobacillus pervagus]
MKTKRYLFLSIIMFSSMMLLMGRLMQIQLLQAEDFSRHGVNLLEESVHQRIQQLVIDEGRGQFLDRHGDPVTYKEIPVMVLFPFLENRLDLFKQLEEIIDVPSWKIKLAVEREKNPFIFTLKEGEGPFQLTEREMDKINKLKVPGLIAVKKVYNEQNHSAEHLIGIVKENKEVFEKRYQHVPVHGKPKLGISGLQKQFDELLLSEGEEKLVYHVDGIGGPLFGIDVKYTSPANPYYPIQVKTSIDLEIQTKIEKLMENYPIKKGGIALLDIETNDITALVSKPEINQKNPYGNDGMKNYLFTPLIPGSVFKTVIAAGALEQGIVSKEDKFACSQNIYGKKDKKQLGDLDFQESFAQSCNRTFADLARELQEMDENMIETYADKLSLTGGVSWKGDFFHFEDFQQFREGKANIFGEEKDRKDRNYIAQTGIGQHEVRVTPIAVANMMATIARGGEKQAVRAVQAIEYKNGNSIAKFNKKKLSGETISPITAAKLQKLLRSVVLNEKGTARYLQSAPLSIAGKTGTAQTGRYENEKPLYNKWFAGYFPFENPKYALVAVHADALENEAGVLPLYKDIVSMLYEKERQDS